MRLPLGGAGLLSLVATGCSDYNLFGTGDTGSKTDSHDDETIEEDTGEYLPQCVDYTCFSVQSTGISDVMEDGSGTVVGHVCEFNMGIVSACRTQIRAGWIVGDGLEPGAAEDTGGGVPEGRLTYQLWGGAGGVDLNSSPLTPESPNVANLNAYTTATWVAELSGSALGALNDCPGTGVPDDIRLGRILVSDPTASLATVADCAKYERLEVCFDIDEGTPELMSSGAVDDWAGMYIWEAALESLCDDAVEEAEEEAEPESTAPDAEPHILPRFPGAGAQDIHPLLDGCVAGRGSFVLPPIRARWAGGAASLEYLPLLWSGTGRLTQAAEVLRARLVGSEGPTLLNNHVAPTTPLRPGMLGRVGLLPNDWASLPAGTLQRDLRFTQRGVRVTDPAVPLIELEWRCDQAASVAPAPRGQYRFRLSDLRCAVEADQEFDVRVARGAVSLWPTGQSLGTRLPLRADGESFSFQRGGFAIEGQLLREGLDGLHVLLASVTLDGLPMCTPGEVVLPPAGGE